MLRAASLLFVFGLSTALCQSCPAWQHLPVRLFNDAEVSKVVLGRAKAEAGWLLKSACVELEWVSCPVISVAHPKPCRVPNSAVEFHILLSPLTNDLTEDAMGVAFPTLGANGNAAAFMSRVQRTATANPGTIDIPGLLGHVIAHEIGHLLLKSSAHSPEGLMRADFLRTDLKKAAQRQLRFTPEQAESIISARGWTDRASMKQD